jgi:opacity protein-like surface antigen
MNKLLIVVIFFFCLGLAKAQTARLVSLNLYGAYIFQDRLKFDGFTGYAREGFQYGGGLEYFFQSMRSVEIKYLRQDSRFPLYGPAGAHLNDATDKGTVNYILLGGNNYFGTSSQSKALPYAGLGLGVGIIDSKDGESATKFAWDTRLGVQLRTSSKVSFKLHATLQSIISGAGSDLYVTGGYGVIAVPDYATLLQFGLGGALCFTF